MHIAGLVINLFIWQDSKCAEKSIEIHSLACSFIVCMQLNQFCFCDQALMVMQVTGMVFRM